MGNVRTLTDTVHNSTSIFRKLRLAAGYETHQALAQQLGAPRETVTGWEHGLRPKWRHIRALAEAFNVKPAVCVSKLWNENVGDPCPCGCGGLRVLPKDDGAKCLGIEL